MSKAEDTGYFFVSKLKYSWSCMAISRVGAITSASLRTASDSVVLLAVSERLDSKVRVRARLLPEPFLALAMKLLNPYLSCFKCAHTSF